MAWTPMIWVFSQVVFVSVVTSVTAQLCCWRHCGQLYQFTFPQLFLSAHIPSHLLWLFPLCLALRSWAPNLAEEGRGGHWWSMARCAEEWRCREWWSRTRQYGSGGAGGAAVRGTEVRRAAVRRARRCRGPAVREEWMRGAQCGRRRCGTRRCGPAAAGPVPSRGSPPMRNGPGGWAEPSARSLGFPLALLETKRARAPR